MNKAELLADLAARDWCTNVLTPQQLEVKPDGTIWYSVNCREVIGDSGTYRNIHFYVYDEGGAGELAFYKDNEPSQQSSTSSLNEWMFSNIDAAPNNYKGIQVHWISERWEMVVYSHLIDDAGNLKWQSYYVRKGAGAPVQITNHEAWRLNSLFRI